MTETICKAAYPGPPGSHTAAAAAALYPDARPEPVSGFRAVAEAVAAGEAGYGVLPIESSLAGAVAETHDLLYEHELAIVAEIVQPVRHCLAAAEAIELANVRVVRTHPAAYEQCRRAVGDVDLIPEATTSDAARIVSERRHPAEAALVSPAAAELYGLHVIADDVGDTKAFTRFVGIATHCDLVVDDALMALTFVTDHRPGALHAAIGPLASAGLDLRRLVSRPLPATPFRYRFDAVVAGHPSDSRVRGALRAVEAVTRELRVLGVYTAHTKEDR